VPAPHAFFRVVLRTLIHANAPFLIGGEHALARYIGIKRQAKDLDVMILRSDWPLVARILRSKGIYTRLLFPHWLGKARSGGVHVDIVYSSGNGLCQVDALWFERAVEARTLGFETRIAPPEELLWSKAFVQERERFDGADVIHLLHAIGDRLDWRHLLMRFRGYEAVLLSHLLLWRFVFPVDRDRLPAWVVAELSASVERDERVDPRLCRGPVLSREQYLMDIGVDRYVDGRLPPFGTMTETERRIWTSAIKGRRARRVVTSRG
jgi:hypothetical protein